MLSNARTIISVHGAGMGNMIFSPAGAKVVEIMHPDLPDYFSGIAAALGHDFRFLEGDPLPDRNGKIGLNSDIHADPDVIGRYLREE